ncbi:MAG: hypothetical protein CL940_12330 [Deltaproteobacteria bacterium]|nr:hypothetical protein [Deltaproteobacteria bacterium]
MSASTHAIGTKGGPSRVVGGTFMTRLKAYHEATRAPLGAALTVLPLALIYGLGLLAAAPEARSGVDVVSGFLLERFGVDGYVGVHLGIAAIVIGYACWYHRKAIGKHLLLTAPVILEATLYGLLIGSLILQIMEEQHLLGPIMVPSELLDKVVVAAGAGLHEELLFRLLLMPGVAWLMIRGLAMPKPMAWGVAIVLSSLAFAGAHHLAGEPYTTFAFAYRSLAGVVFASLYLTRGFAVAAWTHAAYDLHVLCGMT